MKDKKDMTTFDLAKLNENEYRALQFTLEDLKQVILNSREDEQYKKNEEYAKTFNK